MFTSESDTTRHTHKLQFQTNSLSQLPSNIMNELNESSFPFPSNLCLTPNNQNTASDGSPIAPGAPIRPTTSHGRTDSSPGRTDTPSSARRLTFEREELFTDDEEDNANLTAGEIRFLNAQNNVLVTEYYRLEELAQKERLNVRLALSRLRLIERKRSKIQNQSWNIAHTLGRCEFDDYVGLH